MLPSKLEPVMWGGAYRLKDERGLTKASVHQYSFANAGDCKQFATALCDAYNSIRDFQIEQEGKKP